MSAPDFPRPFGVPHLPNEETPNEKQLAQQVQGLLAAAERERPTALAGPESAAEQLRNALMLLDHAAESAVELVRDLEAGRRRVAAALALLQNGK